MNVEVNYLAILVAGVIAMGLGFLWYSKMVLGKTWIKEKGFTEESLKQAQKGMGMMYAASFVLGLLTAYFLAHVMALSENFFHYTRVMTGVTTAFSMWLGFVMPVQAGATIFSEKRNWKLFCIDTGYQLVSLLGMGVIIALL